MAEIEALLDRYLDKVDDFWGRRANAPQYQRQDWIWGRAVDTCSNHAGALLALDECLPLYSITPPEQKPGFAIQMVVQDGYSDPGPLPEKLVDYMHYTGEGTWITMQLGRWGHAFADLAERRAIVVLTPRLADRPDLVALYMLNTVLTNFFLGDGYALLHASCLVREGRALLLIAPHNTGKSTTALRLALAGYPLLTDSMVFLAPGHAKPRLLGFSVGRLKLRSDMLAAFPQLRDVVESEYVRGEYKHALDLREHLPQSVHETSLEPDRVTLALLARNGTKETRITPATRQEVLASVMQNSLFSDARSVWRANLAEIIRLVDQAELCHLSIGSDQEGIVKAVDALWEP